MRRREVYGDDHDVQWEREAMESLGKAPYHPTMHRGWVLCAWGCAFHHGTPPDGADAPTVDQGWLSGYSYRKEISIAPPPLAGPLVDFPVGIVLPSDPDLAAHAAADGSDLAVTTSDGTSVLATELESFDAGGLALWAKLPALAGATTLYLYYGGPTANRSSPWGTSFVGVWHMSEAAGQPIHDSVGQHDLTQPIALDVPGSAAGRAGGARDFDGQDDEVSAGDGLALDMTDASFSYSLWVLVATSIGLYDMPFYKGGASANDAGFDCELGTGGWRAYIGDGTSNEGMTFGTETAFLQQWTYLVGVVDRSAGMYLAYANGVQADAIAISVGSLTSARQLQLSPSGNPFHGRIDELRIYSAALTPDWIAAENANLGSPSFLQAGPEQARP